MTLPAMGLFWLEAQYQREREQESGNFRKMPCPFCVSDDFAVVSRIVDVGEVIEIIAK